MIELNEFSTVSYDEQTSGFARANEPGFIYWLWPARDSKGQHIMVRINGEALSELSGIPFGITSHFARQALLKCRDQIQVAANMKATKAVAEIRLEKDDLMNAA